MCGNTTTSRSGSSGSAVRSAGRFVSCGHACLGNGVLNGNMGSRGRPCQAADPVKRSHLPLESGTWRTISECAAAILGGSREHQQGLPSLAIVDSSTTTRDRLAQRRQVVHDVEQHLLEDRAQAARAGLARERLAWRWRAARARATSSSTPSMRNIFWYCLISAFFGSTRIWISASSSSSSSVADHRQPADEFRDQAELDQVLGLGVAQQRA